MVEVVALRGQKLLFLSCQIFTKIFAPLVNRKNFLTKKSSTPFNCGIGRPSGDKNYYFCPVNLPIVSSTMLSSFLR